MSLVRGRGAKPDVEVDPVRVQESGLIKTSLVLDIPDEKGDFDTTMVRDGARELAKVSERWAEYGEREGLEDPVLPLMVIQIPNKERGVHGEEKEPVGVGAEDKLIARVLETVARHWDGFTDDCVAHVIGERGQIEVGDLKIPHIEPQHVQDAVGIRVLLAKDAVSTGWDCPRAEVLVSLRPGKDATYITQLLGRMIRTPLARSVDDDRLNSARCLLPRFDRVAARSVAEQIMGLAGAEAGVVARAAAGNIGPKVLLAPVDLGWNTEVPEEVFDLLVELPSFTKPAYEPNPVKRLFAATPHFAQDGLVDGADEAALSELFGVLDGFLARHRARIEESATEIMTADVRLISVGAAEGAEKGEREVTESTEQRDADVATVEDALRATRRALGTKLVNAYLKRDLSRPGGSEEGAMEYTKAMVAALTRVEPEHGVSVVTLVEDAAERIVRGWFDRHIDDIRLLGEERRAAYDVLRNMARDPERVRVEIPTVKRVDGVDAGGVALPQVDLHVLADEEGKTPLDASLNAWERAVINRELTRRGSAVVAWYRNPSTAVKAALRIPYESGGEAGEPGNREWKSLQPDFVFVERDRDGVLRPAIVDPHGSHLADALPKLRALAAYAEEWGASFGRIESLAEEKGSRGGAVELRRLDLLDPAVREAIREATDAQALYAEGAGHSLSY
jgi:hypothetical protein